MDTRVTRIYQLTGRVQGVYFRVSTVALAQRLGLCGWARNRTDGGLEVVARGEPAAIERLEAFLRVGPPAARVAHLDIQEYSGDVPDRFLKG